MRKRTGMRDAAKARRRKKLNVVVSDQVGFCSGVKRAIKMAQEAAASASPVYSLGPLIHNPQVVEKLRREGIRPLRRLRNGKGVVVIRSHGISRKETEAVRRRGYAIVDATCPFVAKAQENARRISEMGYRLVVVGERKHPEVKGILGHVVDGRTIVIENLRQAKALNFGQRVGIIAQTTVPVDLFSAVVGEIAKKAKEILIINTICSETAKRQDRARALAATVDAVVVVGGRNSANTSRLATLCGSMCSKTYHVETAEEIVPRWFKTGSTVGVVAGASTPKWLVDSIVERLEDL